VFAGLWLLVGLAVWNGFFDLYVSRGAREYGQKQAEFELGQGPPVSMVTIMNDAKRDGLVASSAWALGVIAAGWGTIWIVRRQRT
jgi:hypothetical protein